MNQSPLWKSNN